MAKKINKSQVVRDHLEKNPRATIKEVIEALASKGVKVNYNLVYTIRGKGKAKKRKANRAKAVASYQGAGDPVGIIIGLKQLAAKVGGISNLKKFVDALAG